MSTYEPGTVAMISALNQGVPYRAFFDGQTWRELAHYSFCVDSPVTIHPLIELDLEGEARDTAALLREIIGHWPYGTTHYAGGTRHLTMLADQIESQTKLPRIPEPGLWGVVEAGTQEDPSERKAFVRYPDEGWCADSWSAYSWRNLVDPVLVRDGIEGQS